MNASKLSPWNRLGGRSLGLVCLVGSSPALADSSMMDTLQVHGFLSQAYIVTDNNNFFGSSSDGNGSWDYTELGVNASIRPSEHLLVAAQVLSRRAGEGDDGSLRLDYGVLDWQMVNQRDRTIGAQFGRFKNPFGFYNQTRDVSFTRPSILLPQSIYFDRTRSLALAADGVSVYYEERLDNGVLRTQFGAGQAQVGDDVEYAVGLENLPGGFEPDTSAIGQVRYEHDGGRVVVALSAASVNADYDSPGQMPGDGELAFEPWILSAQYNAEYWSLTAEYALRDVTLDGFNAFPDQHNKGESWYVQYTRRFMDDWQWMIRYDSLVNNREDRDGSKYEASGRGPAYSQFADDVTLGLQWQPHPNLMVSGEYHNVDGTGWLPTEDNPDPDETSRRWDMWLLQMSLRF